MNAQNLATKLAQIDELETWKSHVEGVEASARAEAFKLAEPIWVKRMLDDGKLLVHPDVRDQLQTQGFMPSDLQKRMIWASVLGADESPNRRERFGTIKALLLNRYGRDWWEDVYQRKNNVFAARERIKKNLSGPVTSAFVTSTILGAECGRQELLSALKMITKD